MARPTARKPSRDRIDTVGIDRVVFGTDGPTDMALDGPISWRWSLESLSQAGQAAIRWKTPEKRLGI
jgi:predicted TIM-barrel fold metal-dependent hydrolase